MPSSRSRPVRCALRLEPLEARDVPVTLFVWDGGGAADQRWSTAANWVGDVAPTAATADPTGVVIQFNGGAQSAMDINGLTVDRVAFVGNSNRATIGTGVALRLNGGVLTDNVTSTGTGNVLDNADTAPTSTSELALVGAAPVFRTGAGADLTVQAFVSGTQGITKLGAGTFNLRNLTINRSFSGPVNLTEGTTVLGSRPPDYSFGFGITIRDSLTVGAGARVVVVAGGFDQLGATTYNGRPVRQGSATVSLGAGASLEFPSGGLHAVKSLTGLAGSTVRLENAGGTSTQLSVGYPFDPAVDVEFAGAITGGGSVHYSNLGTWTLSGPNTVEASFYVNAGTLRAGAVNALSGESLVFLFDTTLDLNGFDQTVRGVGDELVPGSATSAARVLLGSATLTIRSILPEATFRGTISGTGGLTLTGPGRLSLSGTLEYTGVTVVRDGAVLNVNGTQFSDITLDNSALTGGGEVGDVGSVGGGEIGPGNSPGRLTVGSLTLGATDTITAELLGTAAGTQYDQIVARGPVRLAGTRLDVRLGFTPPPGARFTVLDNRSGVPVAGEFAGLPEGATLSVGGVTFRLTYRGGDGNDVVLSEGLQPPANPPGAGATGPAVIATGVGPFVRLFNPDGTLRGGFTPFAGFTGNVDIATGDVNGDNVADIIVGAGAGASGGHVKVFDGVTNAEIRSFLAFPGFTGGVSVGAGDIDRDGRADIIVGAGAGAAGGHVKVFSGLTGAELRSFFAFQGFTGGVNVAGGDTNNDGAADIVVGSMAGAPNGHVKVFDGQTNAELRSFFTFTNFGGGASVAAADLDGDRFAEIIVGADSGTVSAVKAFDGRTNAEVRSFIALGTATGARVGAADLNGNNLADIIVGAAPGGAARVRTFDGLTLAQLADFDALGAIFSGGVAVA